MPRQRLASAAPPPRRPSSPKGSARHSARSSPSTASTSRSPRATTGLDPRTRQELWRTVGELRDEGTTVLLTTQYLEEADHLAQRIAVVNHGRIVAEGTPEQLKRRLAWEMLFVRLAEPAQAARAAEALADLAEGEALVVDGAEATVHFAVVGAGASAEAVRRLDARGIAIAALELRQPSLDDVFMALTGHPADEQGVAGESAGAPPRSPPPSGVA